MSELIEFAEALLDQIAVEVSEEREIKRLGDEISSDPTFGITFESLKEVSERLFPEMIKRAEEFTRIKTPKNLSVNITELDELKILKAKKVYTDDNARTYVDEIFAALAAADVPAIAALAERDIPRFLVYSTYAKSYLSKISTTYGDYMDTKVHLNSFVLSRYPQIILYKQGKPYDTRQDPVRSGYIGAIKMTILEEIVHSMQSPLEDANSKAVIRVNLLNEELAKIIMSLDDSTVNTLLKYLKLDQVPNDFAIARRANLFFMLNPDNFVAQVLGPDVMVYTNVEIDSKINDAIPELSKIYEQWLAPIQTHHAAFTVMEGMAEFVVRNVLESDPDFEMYLHTFMDTDMSSYRVRKSIGRDFVGAAYDKFGVGAFKEIMERIPTTRNLKSPPSWINATGTQ